MSTTTVWAVTLYHDTPDNAAEVASGLDRQFSSDKDAIAHAKAALNEYWTSATVELGHVSTWRVPEDKVTLRRFVHDRTVWHVGPTWVERA